MGIAGGERGKRALLLLFFFLTPLVGLFLDQLFQIHLEIGREQREFMQLLREQIKEVHLSCSGRFQMSRQLSTLHRECQDLLDPDSPDFAPERIINKYAVMKNGLPPHDLLVAREFPALFPMLLELVFAGWPSQPILWHPTGKGFADPQVPYHWPLFAPLTWSHPALVVCFSALNWNRLKPDQLPAILEIMGTDRKHAYFKKKPAVITEALRYPFPAWELNTLQNYIHTKPEGMFCGFRNREGNAGLFWFYPAYGDPGLLVLATMDLSSDPEAFAVERLLKSEPHGRFGIAFLPVGEGESRFSDYFRHFPKLRAALESFRRKGDGTIWEGVQDGQFICMSPGHLGTQVQIAVAGQLPTLHAQTWEQELYLLILAGLIMIGTIFILRRTLWERGPRWGIGILLTCVFLTASGIPAGLAKFLFRSGLVEKQDIDRFKAEEVLWEHFATLDRRFQLMDTDMRYRMHAITHHPHVKTWLSSEERARKEGFPGIFAATNPQYPVAGPHEMLLSSMAGPGTFGTSYARQMGDENTGLITTLFRPLLQKFLSRANPDIKPVQSEPQGNQQVQLADIAGEFQEDLVLDFFRGMFGRTLFQTFQSDFFTQVGGGNLLAHVNVVIAPLASDKVFRHIILFLWSNFEIDDQFLNHFIQARELLPAHTEFLAVRRSENQRFYKESRPNVSPDLWHLTDRVRRTQVPQISRKWEDQRNFLMAAMPSRTLKNYFVSCLFSLEDFLREQANWQRKFQVFVFGSVFLALFFGLLINLHFMTPLRRLGAAIQRIEQQDFACRLDEARDDEFGSLAKTFNLMASGLQEGTLLGKFVSSAVLQVVRNKDAYERALRGEMREITVVFSSLKGFEQYRQTHTPAEILGLLNRHLEAANRGVRQFGGIIDKVIGDKVMLFFDHQAMGGAKQAMTAVLGVIREIHRDLRDAPVPPAIGVNSGTAIAGILGAKQVHLDYTVIGDAVNAAARLNSVAYKEPDGGVILSGTSVAHLPAGTALRQLGDIQVKGKDQSIAAFKLSL